MTSLIIAILTRVSTGAQAQAQKVLVRGLSVSTPNQERDLVNFPQRTRQIERSPVRMLVFPEEWFTALYPKTGVSGPYMFLGGMFTFLASKEYFVMEHDFYVGIGLAAVLTTVIKQVSTNVAVSKIFCFSIKYFFVLLSNLSLQNVLSIRWGLTSPRPSTRSWTRRRPS